MPRYPRLVPAASIMSDSVYSSLAGKARGRPEPICPLHVGDTWLDPMPEARAEAQLGADHERLHNYAPVQGEPALLDAIEARLMERWDARVDRECIQVMAGATSGFSIVCQTLIEPREEVIVLAPFWPLIRGIIAARGATPVEVPFFTRLDEPGFDAEAVVEAAVTEHTSAVYVNSPNNPTGRVLGACVLDAIARVAGRHDLWILSDEAYEDLSYAEAPAEPLWKRGELSGRVVACHTLSKSYGMAGARVGYAHGPAQAMRAIRGMQTFQTYCAARPMQFAAERALRHGHGWLAHARELYAKTGRMAAEMLGLPAPHGGIFLFFDAAPYLRRGEDLAGFLDRCLEAGVLLTPGTASGSHYGSWVRLCFTAVPPRELEAALTRLGPVLAT